MKNEMAYCTLRVKKIGACHFCGELRVLTRIDSVDTLRREARKNENETRQNLSFISHSEKTENDYLREMTRKILFGKHRNLL